MAQRHLSVRTPLLKLYILHTGVPVPYSASAMANARLNRAATLQTGAVLTWLAALAFGIAALVVLIDPSRLTTSAPLRVPHFAWWYGFLAGIPLIITIVGTIIYRLNSDRKKDAHAHVRSAAGSLSIVGFLTYVGILVFAIVQSVNVPVSGTRPVPGDALFAAANNMATYVFVVSTIIFWGAIRTTSAIWALRE